MIAEMQEALQPHLSAILGREVEPSVPVLLAGGASKEAWAVDAGGERLLVRRAAGSVIHRHTLSLADEFEVLRAAHEAGVTVPRPYGYIADLEGREAFVMERLEARRSAVASCSRTSSRGRGRRCRCRWPRSWRR